MKKRLIKNLLLVLTMVVLCFAVGVMASAEDRAIIDSGECGAQGDNVIWTLYDDGELVISGEGEMADYVEKNSDYGYSHREQPWWEYKSTIKTVIFGEGISCIGKGAFSQMSNIVSVEFSDSIVYIDDLAFEECAVLTDLNLPKNLERIGERAFEFCEALQEVEFPNKLLSLGSNAFAWCYDLKKIYISESLTKLEEDCFVGCFSLQKFEVAPQNNSFSTDGYGALFNKDKTTMYYFPAGLKIEKYKVPDTVTLLDGWTFYGNICICEIYIPESVEEINIAGTFDLCLNLRKITYPGTIPCIPFPAECLPTLQTVVISDGVETIDDNLFIRCPILKEVYIKDMDVDIGSDFIATDIYVQEEIIEEYSNFIYDSVWDKDGITNIVDYQNNEEIWNRVDSYHIYLDEYIYTATIYCHAGSTAEAYAIENGIKYELTHFYEGEWTYDYDNMIRYRKCIHCDELETEALETTEDGDVDIIAPVDPDADFTVDVITDYVIIEETLSENISGDFEIVKAFDINLKNKDGVHIQPDGTVKVKLPVDWTKEGVYKVYRVNDDGTLTDMKAYREGSHMVFDTDHFSVYVIVDESEKVDIPTAPDEPQEETKLTFWEKLVDLIKSFFELIASIFKK